MKITSKTVVGILVCPVDGSVIYNTSVIKCILVYLVAKVLYKVMLILTIFCLKVMVEGTMRTIYSVCVSLATGLKEMICLTL